VEDRDEPPRPVEGESAEAPSEGEPRPTGPGRRKGRHRGKLMETQLLVLTLVTIGLAVYAFQSGGMARLEQGGRETVNLVLQVWPNFVIGMVLAGLLSVTLPSGQLSRFLGEESGMSGILIATAAGMLTPGGPYFQFPIIAALYRNGVAPGPLAAYVTAWSVIPINRTLIWEVPFLGFQFSAARIALSLAMPILVGLGVPPLMRILR
jgi:uncharacterized membrane protein YraQ (UPF0718 family)